MQNTRIEAVTEKTLVLGIDDGSETHYANDKKEGCASIERIK